MKKQIHKNPALLLGATILLALLFVAIFSPWIAPYSPHAISLEQELCLPSAKHLLGCDANGTDILSILFYGTRVSLFVGVIATLFCVLIASVLGSIAGYYGGRVDAFL